MDFSVASLQLLPLLTTALSKAAISVEKSVNVTTGNLSEAAESLFVSQSLDLVMCTAVHVHMFIAFIRKGDLASSC